VERRPAAERLRACEPRLAAADLVGVVREERVVDSELSVPFGRERDGGEDRLADFDALLD
jgi:hypothetical protein